LQCGHGGKFPLFWLLELSGFLLPPPEFCPFTYKAPFRQKSSTINYHKNSKNHSCSKEINNTNLSAIDEFFKLCIFNLSSSFTILSTFDKYIHILIIKNHNKN
jgi:hypothetical protein